MVVNYSLKDFQNTGGGGVEKEKSHQARASNVPWNGSSWMFRSPNPSLLRSPWPGTCSIWSLLPSVSGSAELRRCCTEGSEAGFCWWPQGLTVHTRPGAVIGPRARSRFRARAVSTTVKAKVVRFQVSPEQEDAFDLLYLLLLLWKPPLWRSVSLGLTHASWRWHKGLRDSLPNISHLLPPSPLLSVTMLAVISGFERERRNRTLF